MDVKNIIKIGNLENQVEILRKVDELAAKSGAMQEELDIQKSMLERMDKLAVKSAEGIYNCTNNQKAIQEGLDAVIGKLAAMEGNLSEIHEAAVTKK